MTRRPASERIDTHIAIGKPDECWPWQGKTNDDGYGRIEEFGLQRLAHRVAYARVHGPIPFGVRIRHDCDNPLCCNPAHLLPGTDADNVNDMVERGRVSRGEQHPRAKLTEDDVREIRRIRKEEGVTYAALSRQFNVPTSAIGAIVRRKNWAHVPDV